MRRPLVIKVLAALILLLAVVYAVARLDNWMAIRGIDTPPPPPAQEVAPSLPESDGPSGDSGGSP